MAHVIHCYIARDPNLEVVGSASSGRIALMKIPLLHPDVVVFDVEMPAMHGVDALAEIRKLYPQLPVILLSEPTDRGVAATIDALTLGAKDYRRGRPALSENPQNWFQIGDGKTNGSGVASLCDPDDAGKKT